MVTLRKHRGLVPDCHPDMAKTARFSVYLTLFGCRKTAISLCSSGNPPIGRWPEDHRALGNTLCCVRFRSILYLVLPHVVSQTKTAKRKPRHPMTLLFVIRGLGGTLLPVRNYILSNFPFFYNYLYCFASDINKFC